MSHPHSLAWNKFNTSRTLAHNSSAFGNSSSSTLLAVMIGTGSLPVSAMRPAKTETTAGTSRCKTAATLLTCFNVKIAVTFNWTCSSASSLINGIDDSPRELVIGIFTYTFCCQSRIFSACRFISENSSENTSKEIGLSLMNAKASLAKDS